MREAKYCQLLVRHFCPILSFIFSYSFILICIFVKLLDERARVGSSSSSKLFEVVGLGSSFSSEINEPQNEPTSRAMSRAKVGSSYS
ncbi:hypothetical protein HanRHA438_Chr07g0295321 [Helianthus annuus]|nr:hypothetical protein HanRHA438_Chr07g0295321 [Helianthus annuus]